MILCAPSLFSEVSGEAAYARSLARALVELVPGAGVFSLKDRVTDERYVPAGRFFPGRRSFPVLRAPAIFSRITLWPWALPLLLRGKEVVFVLHGVEAWRRYPPPARWVFRKARAFLSVSRYTAERFFRENTLSRPWYLLPPTLDPFFPGDPAPSVSIKCPYLLTVARLSKDASYKGVDLVIRALYELQMDFPALQYVVIGGGDLLSRYRRLSEELGLRHRVHFLGERREVAPFFRGATLFVLVSRGEGFGISFLEAMYFRKPVVGSSAGGIPEVVRQGVNGLLVPYGDIEALTSVLRRLLTQEEEARRMGENGHRILREEYVFPRFREKLRQILRELEWV